MPAPTVVPPRTSVLVTETTPAFTPPVPELVVRSTAKPTTPTTPATSTAPTAIAIGDRQRGGGGAPAPAGSPAMETSRVSIAALADSHALRALRSRGRWAWFGAY